VTSTQILVGFGNVDGLQFSEVIDVADAEDLAGSDSDDSSDESEDADVQIVRDRLIGYLFVYFLFKSRLSRPGIFDEAVLRPVALLAIIVRPFFTLSRFVNCAI
jgi:hypothetical protein